MDPVLSHLPVLAVCGHSGAGKTTLIESLVPRLLARGLAVAVVKHDVHGVRLDRPGKDSDRLFRAGADVFLQGPQESFLRRHAGARDGLEAPLLELLRSHDLVLVEGHKATPLPKVWLLGAGECAAPPGLCDPVLDTLPRDGDRPGRLMALLADWLPRQWLRTPVYGCVLIGGRSRRMGHPKHLIETAGRTWVERTAGRLAAVAERVVVAGAGELPGTLSDVPRLPDVTDTAGPLAGLLAALRWAPRVSWLVAACDMPDISSGALAWLLAQRAPGVWAVLPRVAADRPEPLLAHYDYRAAPLLEALARRGRPAPRALDGHPRVSTPTPPAGLAGAWRNVNTPCELGPEARG